MSKRIFVSATNTDIGKTYTTQRLLKTYALQGYRVGVIKIVETGVVNDRYPDGDLLLQLTQELNEEFKDVGIEDIVPISFELPAAPFVASGGEKFDFVKADIAVEKLEERCDILIFEGAGGLLVPVDAEYMVVDLIKRYEASALLVTHCVLGCINDTLLSVEALKARDIKHCVAFNCKGEESGFLEVSEPYFKAIDFEVLKVDEDIDKICDVLYNLQN